jgi:hypothetical protein
MSVKTRLSLAAIIASTAVAATASANIVAGWTITTAFPTGTGNIPTGNSYLPPGAQGAGVADLGEQTTGSVLTAYHANALAQYTSPAGNGSSYSFSSTYWQTNDYYEARANTTGYTNISFSWDQCRSSTGPSSFRLIMSTDGTNWTNLLDYTVLQSGGGGAPGTWSTTTYLSAYTTTQAISSGAADNQSMVIFRLVNLSATGATNGTNRIDNVTISGTAAPAPGALALLGVAGLAARRRRR